MVHQPEGLTNEKMREREAAGVPSWPDRAATVKAAWKTGIDAPSSADKHDWVVVLDPSSTLVSRGGITSSPSSPACSHAEQEEDKLEGEEENTSDFVTSETQGLPAKESAAAAPAVIEQTLPSQHPLVVGVESHVDHDCAAPYMRTDEAMEQLWSLVRNYEAQADQDKGQSLAVSSHLRWLAVAGGGQDNPRFQEFGKAASKETSLDSYPSMILTTGGAKITAQISLATDPVTGEHKRDHIQFVFQDLNVDSDQRVPLQLIPDDGTQPQGGREPKCAPHGMSDVFAYILGNMLGMRGLRVVMTSDNALLTLTGGFESSDAGRVIAAAIGHSFDRILCAAEAQQPGCSPLPRRPVTWGQLIGILRQAAPTVLLDRTAGGQGMLAAIGGMSRNFFVGGMPCTSAASPSRVHQKVILQRGYGREVREAIASYLESRSVVINPGTYFKGGRRMHPDPLIAGERLAHYTSGMGVGLAQLGHPKTLREMQSLRELVGEIDAAIQEQDDAAFVRSTRAYTELRLRWQARYLRLAWAVQCRKEECELPANAQAQLDAALQRDATLRGLLQRISELPALAEDQTLRNRALNVAREFDSSHDGSGDVLEDDVWTDLVMECLPYVGGEKVLVATARRYGVGYNPCGAGGFGVNWVLYGPPESLESCLGELGLQTVITSESFQASMQLSKEQFVQLRGRVEGRINRGAGYDYSPAFVRTFGNPWRETLPVGCVVHGKGLEL